MVTSRDSAVGMQLQVARCTVLGHLNDNIPEKELDGIMARFKTLHAAAHGVDALREDDIYMRLNVEKVFYVGGLGTDARYATTRLFRDIADHFPFLGGASLRFPTFRRLCTCILYSDYCTLTMKILSCVLCSDSGVLCFRADFVSADDYKAAEADPLCDIYDTLIEDINASSMDELTIVSENFLRKIRVLEESEHDSEPQTPAAPLVTSCRLAHIDRLGIDVHTTSALSSGIVDIRIPFVNPVTSESEARSAITMMAQQFWEQDKNYTPPSIKWDEEGGEDIREG